MKALTTAQAEVYERLASDGYLTDGFLPHEVFRARDNADNGARRTLRRMIDLGYFQPTNFEDGHGNRYYKPDSAKLIDAYQAWLAKH